MRGKKLSIIEREIIMSRYEEEGATKLAKELGRSIASVSNFANRFGLKATNWFKRTAESRTNNSKTVNVNYFKGDWTREKARLVGYIAADGNIRNGETSCIQLECSSIDDELIWEMRGYLSSNHKVTTRPGRWKGDYLAEPTTYCKIHNRTLIKDLQALSNLNPRKSSAQIQIPQTLESHLKDDFIRGYFDGDGYVQSCCSELGFCGCYSLMVEIRDHLCNKIKVSYRNIEPDGSIFQVRWMSKDDLTRLYHYLYDDAIFYLKRKKKVLETWIDQV